MKMKMVVKQFSLERYLAFSWQNDKNQGSNFQMLWPLLTNLILLLTSVTT